MHIFFISVKTNETLNFPISFKWYRNLRIPKKISISQEKKKREEEKKKREELHF